MLKVLVRRRAWFAAPILGALLVLPWLTSCGSSSGGGAAPFVGSRSYRLPGIDGAGFASADLTVLVTYPASGSPTISLTSSDSKFSSTTARVTAHRGAHIEATAADDDDQPLVLALDFTDSGNQVSARLSHGASSATASGSNLASTTTRGAYTLIAWNDLGMHCMNQDFSSLMILPPYNTLHAQLIERGEEPRIIGSGATLTYLVPGNTKSSTKTNFWRYSAGLLGTAVPNDVGLTGNRLSGSMVATGANDWNVTGIPITPKTDAGAINAYQLATVKAVMNGQQVATTQAVVPVSWEISCNLCHKTAGISTDLDILRKHDRKHATNLANQRPVNCARCHAELNLGSNGVAGVKSLSAAMHSSHANRMAAAGLSNECYACHPGVTTNCQRDVHKAKGITCKRCHVSMAAVGSTARRPWIDEPRCADCHSRSGFQFEQPGTRFRDSKGHHGIRCPVCHGSPHATAPATNAADNVQAIALQGHAGTINTCTVCHTQTPDDKFDHRFEGSD